MSFIPLIDADDYFSTKANNDLDYIKQSTVAQFIPGLNYPLAVLMTLTFSSQGTDGERSVIYDTVGPNVCMGDHKVTFD